MAKATVKKKKKATVTVKKKKVKAKKATVKRKTSKPKAKAKSKKPKKPQKNGKTNGQPGRPTVEYTAKQKQKIEECALMNCHTSTIATLTGIPETSLRRDFGEVIRLKRAEHKILLRKIQFSRAKNDKSPAMAMFLGKNVLEQDDKQGGLVPIELPAIHITVESGKKK